MGNCNYCKDNGLDNKLKTEKKEVVLEVVNNLEEILEIIK
jgi:hypothetical protein